MNWPLTYMTKAYSDRTSMVSTDTEASERLNVILDASDKMSVFPIVPHRRTLGSQFPGDMTPKPAPCFAQTITRPTT